MFMEHVAQHTGMPPSTVPPPGLPLPAPPTFSGSAPNSTPSSSENPAHDVSSASPNSTPLYPLDHMHGASVSPHLSPEDDDNFGLALGLLNPEETLQRIAHGVLGGYENGCGSAGGRLSPLDDNQAHWYRTQLHFGRELFVPQSEDSLLWMIIRLIGTMHKSILAENFVLQSEPVSFGVKLVVGKCYLWHRTSELELLCSQHTLS